ncbi:efflux RND transporter periplasmic adaptor subunit [Pelobium sp.]|nr:efflux RND transporter periplasmic adaptor subunit [Pelobium sp.]MDA9555760.1 efflux RND transporter periplasmic adaptor subunit [Pelobium sp.]
MKNKLSLLLLIGLFAACQSQPTEDGESVKAVTPVTIAHPSHTILNDELTLNANSVYLLKTSVKANTNGYIMSSNVSLGQYVKKGQVLFVLKTKEAQNLGNTINKLDPSFKFSGLNKIISNSSGFISSLNHQAGDYVQDGEALAEITDRNSFGFLMNVPYEYNQLLELNKDVNIVLPDGRRLPGMIAQIMPALDSVSQTQRVLVKVKNNIPIPENLIATIKLSKKTSSHLTVPTPCVLTDESQQNFWIMKMINDSTAVKIPIKKGIENNDRIEILSPVLNEKDQILLTGNYGLADTASVKIQH